MNITQSMLSGAIMMGFFTIALFFMKFWRKTNDLFFLVFALSFCIMGIERCMLALYHDSEMKPFVYIMRLLAFSLILLGVIYKNVLDRKR